MHHIRISRSIGRMGLASIFGLAPLILLGGCAALRESSCDQLLAIGGGDTVASRLHYRKGLRHFDRGKLEHAAKEFQIAIDRSPSNAAAHNNLGLVYFRQKQLAPAASEFETAARLLPQSATPKNNLGMTLEAAGRTLEARENYFQAHQLAPTSPLYLGNLVRSRIQLGEDDELLHEQLSELRLIETRPDWIDWINDQLYLIRNPHLDRGPPPPNLNKTANGKAANGEEKPASSSKLSASEQALMPSERRHFPPAMEAAGEVIWIDPNDPTMEMYLEPMLNSVPNQLR